jgi:centromeric protein E
MSSFEFKQKGTTVEKLTEETLRDKDHLKDLLAMCEGAG